MIIERKTEVTLVGTNSLLQIYFSFHHDIYLSHGVGEKIELIHMKPYNGTWPVVTTQQALAITLIMAVKSIK